MLIVGCGGSGGAVLGCMMDGIRVELATHGIDKIPGGWQFVHVDVPVDADGDPSLRVKHQGGTYIPTGPGSGMTYEALYTQVVSTLAQRSDLAETATWLPPEPKKVTVNISASAGSLRALGRTITLSKAGQVRQRLQDAWTRMFTAEADREMHDAVARAKAVYPHFDGAQDPLIIVVSSMAGGAGASMVLDVCRILTSIPALNPNMTVVFGIAPDTFDDLAPAHRMDSYANGLAATGEIMAAQLGVSGEHDKKVLAPLAIQVDTWQPPFGMFTLVGCRRGVGEKRVGNESVDDTYRGIGRGLSAFVTSDEAIERFIAYDLVKKMPTFQRRDVVGWGEDRIRDLQWNSFGFARLSLGRDRYRHYAAQRIARSAVDRLRGGHLQPHESPAGDAQLRRLVDAQWPVVVQRVGLPVDGSPQRVMNWLARTARPRRQADAAARPPAQILLPEPSSVETISQQREVDRNDTLPQSRSSRLQAGDSEEARPAPGWAQTLLADVQAVVSEGVASFGIPYGREIVMRVQRVLEDVLCTQLKSFKDSGGDRVQARRAAHVSKLLFSLSRDGLGPLGEALDDSLEILEHAVNAPAVGVGLEDMRTDAYRAWPSEQDEQVPDRFKAARNEILITPASTFPSRFEADLVRSTDPVSPTLPAARQMVDRAVIMGSWPVGDGFSAPGGLLTQTAEWHPAPLAFDPETGALRTQARANYRYGLAPHELLGRALAYVSRAHTSFDDFCSVSLAEYANDPNANDAERSTRHADLVAKLRQTVAAAEPPVQADQAMVQVIHSAPVPLQYRFSAIPFSAGSSLIRDLSEVVMSDDRIDRSTVDNWRLDRHSRATRIDVFGSYRPYSPLVFTGLWEPVRKKWTGLAALSRRDFWDMRRARPLPAALPLGAAERRAMVAGWYIGRSIGLVKTPGRPYESPVTIWDAENQRSLDFPSPLLTPPACFRAAGYDWLPAVLESILLAMSAAHLPPALDSLRPYMLLRKLYDSGDYPAHEGSLRIASDGVRALARWLRDGMVVPGDPVEGDRADDRLELVKARLAEQLTVIEQHLSPTTGPRLMSRDIGRSPMARDLAADSVWAIHKVERMLDEAVACLHGSDDAGVVGALGWDAL